MHIIEIGQAAAVFAVAVGLSMWRVVAAPGATTRSADHLLGLCTAISSCWMLVACLALTVPALPL